jgi:spermidine synthase
MAHYPKGASARIERVATMESTMATATLSASEAEARSIGRPEKLWPYYLLFFLSGFPALLYQIVWQRALFTIYGVNIESVTVIVTVFMLGLGFGSLAGGRLSALARVKALRAFGTIEILIGAFGAISLTLFHRVAQFTAGSSTAATGAITFLLLLIPTLLMGSTLPLLVAHLVRRTANVGESVGSLYAVNTFGSGFACLMAALVLMRALGETGSVRMAACLNLVVGTTALIFPDKKQPDIAAQAGEARSQSAADRETIPLRMGMLLAGLTGFIALAFEILWYRIYSFTSAGTASCFAMMMAFYLFGIAYGAYAVHDLCKRKFRRDLKRTLAAASLVVLVGTIGGYLLGPLVSVAVRFVDFAMTFVFVAAAAALLGAAFPLLAHAAIGPGEQAGKKLSYLYLSNIIGSALGSFLIGFVVMDHWSTGWTSMLLLGLGLAAAVTLAMLARPMGSRVVLAGGLAVSVVLALTARPMFSGLYERLLFKSYARRGNGLVNLVENRSGVIAVDRNETVYGGGVYDGHFNIDPMHDTNGIFRAYAMAGLHPDPREVLVIGLSSGSWAQILANYPSVRDVTIVEINPGYLGLIRQRPSVASLLSNPKVHIAIDDGRRWLVSHPERKFDFILMNTTYHWRANASNLLSVEFLGLVRQHLKPGGVEYYNTTESAEVQLTGATVFPYAMRVSNFLAVSDSPIVFDREHWKAVLESYRIDGRRVFDLSDAAQRAQLEEMISIPERVERPEPELDHSVERETSLRNRMRGLRVVTDDNMGAEWH